MSLKMEVVLRFEMSLAIALALAAPATAFAATLPSPQGSLSVDAIVLGEGDQLPAFAFAKASYGGATATAEAFVGCTKIFVPGLRDCQGTAQALSQYTYYVGVDPREEFFIQTGLDASVKVPVLYDVSISRTIFSGGGSVSAQATVHDPRLGTTTYYQNSADGDGDPESFSRTFSTELGVDEFLRFDKFARVVANAAGLLTMPRGGAAWVDPQVAIDPNWTYAQFAGLIDVVEATSPFTAEQAGTPPQIPLPASWASFATGALVFAAAARRR